jgi:uncharacterized protein (DUF58 family)
LTAALLAGRPAPAILVTPFALFLAIGLVLGPPPPIDVRLRLDRDRVIEGDTITVTVTGAAGVEIAPVVPVGVDIAADVHDLDSRSLTLRPRRWGAFDVGTIAARTTDPLRLWRREALLSSPLVVRVHPTTERLRRAITASELQPFVGQHTSRARGDGFDFADLRPYAVGDRRGAVNWRASARRGDLWVNDRHPDRTGDIVLLLDTFGSAGEHRVEVLDRAVHTLAALASAYERTHDRVGLLTFGGHLRWLRPSSGRTNLARIVDGMLDTERLLTDVWADVVRVPVGAIPSHSLLVAVTSLDNDTALHTLLDLRARGFDLAVLTVEPVSDADARVRRLDALLRDARRRQLERFGVAVASVDDGLAPAVEEVGAWRRQTSRSSR